MGDVVPGYTIVNKLGDGARSQVYQVVKISTGETFTLKRVARDKSEDDRFLQQAITEFELASKLNHPCLRKSLEIHKTRSLLTVVQVQVILEYVDGVSLDRRRPERLDQILDIFIHVAEGLHVMHEAGYLHTDIKPNNILLTNTGEVKIIDFGQSCAVGFRKPRIQGTPDYIAPEQVERRPLSRQTDVFNLGATLYWAITGQAYPTMITKQGRQQDSRKRPPAPHEINPQVPPGLSRCIMDACAYDRVQRPRDMKDVINKLQMAQAVLVRTEAATVVPEAAEVPSVGVPPLADIPASSEDSFDYSALHEIVDNSPHDQDQPPGSPS
jgi:serine/threonine protein kinase